MKYLSSSSDAARASIAIAMQWVISQGGPGPYRQVLDLLRLRLRRIGFNTDEYYSFSLWRKDLPAGYIEQIVPQTKRTAFNHALKMQSRPRELAAGTAIIEDKVSTESLMRSLDLPCTQTLAGYAPTSALPDHVLTLADADAITTFLAETPSLPIFGKPRADSLARGAVAIASRNDAGDEITFLNRISAPIASLAAEIVTDWTSGYLFQPFYQSQADLRRITGPAMASLRIVTLRTHQGTEPFYAVLRIPSKTAMHDGDTVNTRIWCVIDLKTGAIIRARNPRDAFAPDVTHWLDPDTPLPGYVLPHWDQALANVLRAHQAFPAHGILGWDVFLTDDGALINEVNENPGHVYQAAAGHGMLTPELSALYARALAYAKSA